MYNTIILDELENMGCSSPKLHILPAGVFEDSNRLKITHAELNHIDQRHKFRFELFASSTIRGCALSK